MSGWPWAAGTDRQFAALAEAIGHPEWVTDPRFADGLARYRHQAQLDAAIEAWTQTQDKRTAMDLLQARGVPAAAVLNNLDMVVDPQLRVRGRFTEHDRPYVGRHPYPEQSAAFSACRPIIRRVAPTFGADNDYIFAEVLGLDAAARARLAATGVIGEPAPARPLSIEPVG